MGFQPIVVQFGGSILYHQALPLEPLVVQVGASGAGGLFGGTVLSEAHVALGASASAGPMFVTATAGPSLGRAYSGLRQEEVTVPGLYAGVQAELVFLPFLGLGAEAFAHLNAVRPTAGVGIVYAFGRLPGAVFPNPPPTPRRPGL